jgi:hypothetical protein
VATRSGPASSRRQGSRGEFQPFHESKWRIPGSAARESRFTRLAAGSMGHTFAERCAGWAVIPNLIEVQKKSVRALPADGTFRCSSEREDAVCSRCFKSVFPISGLPRELVAGVRRLFDRQLGVQVRQPQGTAPPAHHLPFLRRDGGHRSVRRPARRALPKCGTFNQERPISATSAATGRLQAEVRRGRVPGARHDLRRAAEGHHPPDHLDDKDPETGARPSATSRSRKSSSATSR